MLVVATAVAQRSGRTRSAVVAMLHSSWIDVVDNVHHDKVSICVALPMDVNNRENRNVSMMMLMMMEGLTMHSIRN